MHPLAEKIKSAEEVSQVTEPVPEWDVTLVFPLMGWEEREALRKWAKATKAKDGAFTAHVIAYAARDEKGGPVFSTEDEAWLAKKSPAVLERVCGVIIKLNGLDGGAIEAERKNSEATQSGRSSSP
jgi:hypothetical protein